MNLKHSVVVNPPSQFLYDSLVIGIEGLHYYFSRKTCFYLNNIFCLIVAQYAISQFQLCMCETSMASKLQHCILNCCENQEAFFNFFHLKVSFLILLMHIYFTFQKYVIIIKCIWKYLNPWLPFLNREDISYYVQYIFRKYWQEYHILTVLKDVIVEIEVACTNRPFSS